MVLAACHGCLAGCWAGCAPGWTCDTGTLHAACPDCNIKSTMSSCPPSHPRHLRPLLHRRQPGGARRQRDQRLQGAADGDCAPADPPVQAGQRRGQGGGQGGHAAPTWRQVELHSHPPDRLRSPAGIMPCTLSCRVACKACSSPLLACPASTTCAAGHCAVDCQHRAVQRGD